MPAARGTVRFGIFEVDLAAGELRRSGTRVKLQEQPFQVLAALLERPGEIVSKEELQGRIWKEDTFVDFDRSLATAVNKVRQALGDSASNSRFVETVPRRGYRFLAEVSDTSSRTQGSTRAALIWGTGCLAAVAVVAFLMGRADTESNLQPLSITPLPVTSSPGFEYHPAISSDGARVAYSRDPNISTTANLYVQMIGSDDEPIQLTDSPPQDFSPAWSPDGDYLAFVRFSPERSEIIRIRSIGGPETALGTVSIPDGFLAQMLSFRYLDWSADGKSLAVSQHGGPDSPALFLLEIETGERTPLPLPEVEFVRNPAYSPDGRSLAYAGFQRLDEADIWVQELAGARKPRRVTSQEKFINGLDWTADGTELVFSRGGLWRVGIAGDKPPTMQLGGLLGDSPSIAADSNRLVYGLRDYDSNIWSVPGPVVRQGAGRIAPSRIVSSTRGDDSAALSPDGSRVVFVSNRTGINELWGADTDGSQAKRVLAASGLSPGSPSWSPDGKFIAFDGNEPGEAKDIYLMRADGRRAQRLTTSLDAHDIRPAWSRDGEWIFFASFHERGTGEAAIWKWPVGGGEATKVTDDAGFGFYESTDASLYFHDKIDANGEIWRLPPGGGVRERILSGVESKNWSAFASGICFVKEDDGGTRGLWFYEFETRNTTRFGEVPKDKEVYGSPGLSVSADGERIVLSIVDGKLQGDIMMLDGFR